MPRSDIAPPSSRVTMTRARAVHVRIWMTGFAIVAPLVWCIAADVDPGNPAASALGPAPGASGAIDFGGSGSIDTVIPVGPGPSYPRVPRGISHQPEPFGIEPGLGIESVSPLGQDEANGPLSTRLGLPAELLPEPVGGMTLDEAIDRLVHLNLELRAQSMEVSKARADVLTAGLRGNPLFYTDAALIPYGSFDGSAGGPTQYDTNVTLPLDLNGKRNRRIDAAMLAQRVTEALYQDAVRLQIDNLSVAWNDALAAQATIRFLDEGLKSLDAQKRVIADLVARGKANRTELNNVEIQIDSSDLTLLEARETLDDAKRTLAAMLSIPLEEAETFPIRDRLRWPDVTPPPVEEVVAEALVRRPDLAAFRLGVDRACAEVRLARANRLDDAFLIYQPMTAQEGLVRGERAAYSWAAGVTVPLPVFNRNQGNIARAQATVGQTKTQLANLERQVRLEVERAAAALDVTRATIKRIEEEILPAARENLQLSLAGADADEPAVLSSIEAQRAYGDVARQYLDALVRHRRAMLRLNTVVGVRVLP